ncbi:hypothetical protein NVP1251O_37 [Vibrio phage 1.251.O._10N.261.55.E5]|nr:hypothetical protein NVP1251O_37 [Vibrio phage 1.251.O._10N.261.55.E5]
MPKRLSIKQFTDKARSVHGDKYVYDRSVYVNARNPILINCPTHGDFIQMASSHLQGSGCPNCSAGHRYSTQEFVEKARSLHGGRYNYDSSVYTFSNEKIKIKCSTHGDFEQTPNDHLQGKGCSKCAGNVSLTTEEFVEKAREVHGDLFDYGGVIYESNKTKILIKCPEHGVFEQTPNSHLLGNACAKCSGKHQHTTDEFTGKANDIHEGSYTYERAVYVSNKVKLTITCAEHGDFEQTPDSHLRGRGCHSCAVSGFKSDKQAFLYFLIDTETHSRVKIGISNVPDSRLQDLKNDTPFVIERIDLFETPPEITLQIEKFCHSQLESCGLQGFDGATEWFKFEGGKLEALRAFIRSCGGVTA